MFSESFLESVQKCLDVICVLPKTRKTNVFQTPFSDQSAMYFMPLFKYV